MILRYKVVTILRPRCSNGQSALGFELEREKKLELANVRTKRIYLSYQNSVDLYNQERGDPVAA